MNGLFGTLQAKLEPQTEGNPLEILELKHRLKTGIPDIGNETDIWSSGIVFEDEFGVEPVVVKPHWPPSYRGTRSCAFEDRDTMVRINMRAIRLMVRSKSKLFFPDTYCILILPAVI